LEFPIFSQQELKDVHKKPLPRHVAIIMDGNRRWAKKHSISQIRSVIDGHWAGADVLQNILKAAQEIGIQILTVFAFSTENWQRSRHEVDALIHIFELYLKENREKMKEGGVKFNVIGNLFPFPSSLKEEVLKTIEATKEGKSIEFIVALNYGGRDDLTRAIKKIVKDCLENKLEKEKITEEIIAKYLDTANWEDPDLLIRTSNEMRVSNFLLWQLAYTEIYVTTRLWPEFTSHDLLQAVAYFQEREIRRGR
jgi:undecaprenyl diphosphate synthase